MEEAKNCNYISFVIKQIASDCPVKEVLAGYGNLTSDLGRGKYCSRAGT